MMIRFRFPWTTQHPYGGFFLVRYAVLRLETFSFQIHHSTFRRILRLGINKLTLHSTVRLH
jgi:hypothetical protein